MPKKPPRALHDPVLCLAPGLFLSLVRGQRDNPLEVDYDYGSDHYAFRAPSLLGCDDLRVLQGVVALANSASLCITKDSSSPAAALRGDLHLVGAAAREGLVLLVETSLASVAASAGYGPGRGGAMGDQIRGSLARLASVAVEFRPSDPGKNARAGWRLIAWDTKGAGRNKLRIALNPSLSLCSKATPKFAQIEMQEARRLDGDLARLIHQRLSAWIDVPGTRAKSKPQTVRLAKLMDYAWGASVASGLPPNAAALRQRRSSLRLALLEIEGVGWNIREVADKDLLEISRPSRRTNDAEPQRAAATS